MEVIQKELARQRQILGRQTVPSSDFSHSPSISGDNAVEVSPKPFEDPSVTIARLEDTVKQLKESRGRDIRSALESLEKEYAEMFDSLVAENDKMQKQLTRISEERRNAASEALRLIEEVSKNFEGKPSYMRQKGKGHDTTSVSEVTMKLMIDAVLKESDERHAADVANVEAMQRELSAATTELTQLKSLVEEDEEARIRELVMKMENAEDFAIRDENNQLKEEMTRQSASFAKLRAELEEENKKLKELLEQFRDERDVRFAELIADNIDIKKERDAIQLEWQRKLKETEGKVKSLENSMQEVKDAHLFEINDLKAAHAEQLRTLRLDVGARANEEIEQIRNQLQLAQKALDAANDKFAENQKEFQRKEGTMLKEMSLLRARAEGSPSTRSIPSSVLPFSTQPLTPPSNLSRMSTLPSLTGVPTNDSSVFKDLSPSVKVTMENGKVVVQKEGEGAIPLAQYLESTRGRVPIA